MLSSKAIEKSKGNPAKSRRALQYCVYLYLIIKQRHLMKVCIVAT